MVADRYNGVDTGKTFVIYDKQNGNAWVESTYTVTVGTAGPSQR
jgi:hypothetical protein